MRMTSNLIKKKTVPPLGGHFFSTNRNLFGNQLSFHQTNVLTKYNVDWTINMTSEKTCPPLVAMTNILTTFHEDWTVNVTSRMLTKKTPPPTSGHVFQRTGTIFKPT
ncbi:hypothetical protein DPMN_030929 [Dreissena polymorpha]|uniref:Uncharacterized protein n=1 Tax=Dreissena polymorpha TaxID=45954 RepID=A0A9D4M228_DREPO|nr:hypothetical protein DPMN_030929 [Dreissena polymorpha]